MLKAKEIEQLIKQKKPLPQKSDSFEKFYFHALSVGVELYRQKNLSREDLRLYQQEYRKIYEQLIMWLGILHKHREIEMLLGSVELGNCEKCKLIARLLDGREQN